ncbi:MAG: DUF2911 domain-containing protein [Spirosomataceae bacterium]
MVIEGTNIPKGKYGFFTIPSKEQWTLILNKVWDMHLADDYNPEKDVIRIKVNPKVGKDIVEALTYEVKSNNQKSGTIQMQWEYLTVAFDFQNK